MKQSKNLKRALEILGTVTTSRNREENITVLLQKLAEQRPSAIINAFESVKPVLLTEDAASWNDIRKAYETENIIKAVKAHRALFKSGLKDAVEEVRAKAENHGWVKKNF